MIVYTLHYFDNKDIYIVTEDIELSEVLYIELYFLKMQPQWA